MTSQQEADELLAGHQAKRKPRRIMCSECGKYPADLPSHLCPGCDAYRDHTGAF